MKRLSVRLSVVGAVLALGAAAIAHSVLSDKEAAPDKESVIKTVAQGKQPAAKPPAPIRVQRDESQQASPATEALQPPPSSFFSGDNFSDDTALRTVSHESATDESTKSAAAIPTADPTSAGGGFPVGPPDRELGNALPTAIADSSSGGFPVPPPTRPSPVSEPPVAGSVADAAPASPTSGTLTQGNEQPPAAPGFALSETERPLPTDASTSFPATAPTTSALVASTTPAASAVADNPAARTVSDGLGGSLDSASPPPPSVGRTTAVEDSISTPPPAVGGMSSTPSPTIDTTDTSSRSTPPAVGAMSFGPTAGVAGGVAGAALAHGLSRSDDNASLQSPATMSGAAVSPSAGTVSPATGSLATESLANAYQNAAVPNTAATAPAAHLSNQYDATVGGGNLMPTPSVVPTTGPGLVPGGPAALVASNLPGDRQLEGQQAPSILIEKTAPQEIQVNRQATFQLRVRNNGNAPAQNVVVVDRVPRGTTFISATPAVTPSADGTLVWRFDVIKPGSEVVVSMNLLPQMAGEIGSVAQATFQAQASVRTICTKPELKVDVSLPQQVLIGQPATVEIAVTNIGNGAADKVLIEEDVPEGFTHAAGRELEHEIGTLKPQETRRLTLVIDSKKPGDFKNRLTVRAEGDLFVEDVRPIKVTAPQLKISMQGPSRRYLDRQATYLVHLANPGTASARNVEMVTYLAKGMKYVTSDNQGQYDTKTHAVYWSLEELPADKQGDVHVTVLPIEPGNQKLKTDIHADLGLKDVCEHEVTVEGLAELVFVVSDVADPIEVGSDTTYEIKVTNRGSKADADIQLVAELPPGITPTNGSGPTRASVQGQRVTFGPLARLGPQEEAVFKIHARGAAVGDHIIRAQLRSTELRVAVTKEEMTRVYADN